MTHQDTILDASFLFFHYLCTILAFGTVIAQDTHKK